MGCTCNIKNRVKHSQSINELIENIEYNIILVQSELKVIPIRSKGLYYIGKRVLTLNEKLIEALKRIDILSIMSNDWLEIRDLSDSLFEYFFHRYGTASNNKKNKINEEEIYNEDFSNNEKLLKRKIKQLQEN